MNDRPIEAMHFDPSDGIELKFALTYYAAYPPHLDANGEDIARHLSKLHLLGQYGPGHQLALSDADRHRGENARTVLSYTLVTRLRDGTLRAKAFTPGGVSFADIPPQWWQRVRIDFAENSAEANGSKITGVLVFGTSDPSASKPSVLDDDPADRWMRQNVTQPGQWKRASALSQCQIETRRSWREALAAWNRLPGALRGRRGTHK